MSSSSYIRVIFILFITISFSAYGGEEDNAISCDYELDISKDEIGKLLSFYPKGIWDKDKNSFTVGIENMGSINIKYMACENFGINFSMTVNNDINTQKNLNKHIFIISKIIFNKDSHLIINFTKTQEFTDVFDHGRKVESKVWFLNGEYYSYITIALDDDVKGKVIFEITTLN